MTDLPAKPESRASRINQPDNTPKIGDWYWVRVGEDEEDEVDADDGPFEDQDLTEAGKRVKKTKEFLFCVRHLASNHVQFARCTPSGSESWTSVRYRDLLRLTRIEPNWKQIKDTEIEGKKLELQDAIKALADSVHNAGLISQQQEGGASMLPARIRVSPEDSKKALLKLKEKTIPEHHKNVERITQEIAALHRDMVLPMKIQSARLEKTVEHVDERLFALELYAGLWQQCHVVAKGDPAPADTKIAIRQMLRYMDEECLIDYDGGGMDYSKLEDFDKWIAKPENYTRLAPEPRCIVALQVRRYQKDYGCPVSLFDALGQAREHEANRKTYLLMRNGENLYRLWTEIDFRPQLLPDSNEFTQPFEEVERGWYNFEKKKDDPDRVTKITPDHLNYDKHVEDRKKLIFQYNRIMFLIQGILDRSKVFSPHPPMNLGDPEHVEKYLKLVFDSEKGLPSYNPPKWEEYRDKCNAKIKINSWIWSKWYDEEKDYEYSRYYKREVLRKGRARPQILQVDKVSRDRKHVRVSWPWGTRWGYENPRSYFNRGRWGEWEIKKKRHAWIPVEHVFNLSAYKKGDFKQFLCDAYLKGAYLTWAPQLLTAEKWLAKKEGRIKNDKEDTETNTD